jgi:serine/threonine protein kinase
MKSNEHVKINKLKLIGSGTQADVYTCTVKSLIGGAAQYSGEAIYVTKTKKIVDNFEIANDTFKSMYKEFKIAKNLKHPNVVRYMDFITKKSEKLCEFNIILEFLEGGNLR